MKTVASRVVYENRWMTVREDEIERADGSPGIYGLIQKPDFVLLIPIEGNQVYMVEQFRYPVSSRFMEFPQGSWETKPGADPLIVARGELQEETGISAQHMEFLGHLFIAYGMSNQGFHVFSATGLGLGDAQPEVEEQDIVLKQLSVEEFEDGIRSGVIKDAATLAAWALYRAKSDIPTSQLP
jgi:8-oxo-dGTP pyrophosphatase MutT (NUDIX family)